MGISWLLFKVVGLIFVRFPISSHYIIYLFCRSVCSALSDITFTCKILYLLIIKIIFILVSTSIPALPPLPPTKPTQGLLVKSLPRRSYLDRYKSQPYHYPDEYRSKLLDYEDEQLRNQLAAGHFVAGGHAVLHPQQVKRECRNFLKLK